MARLGHTLRRGDLVVLSGELGAGKTHFVKGIAEGLEIDDRITSPTFALHQRYEGRETLHHLDVYRLDDLAETIDLDLPELMESGVTVIEWGDTILDVLPTDRLLVRLMFDDDDPGESCASRPPTPVRTGGGTVSQPMPEGGTPC